MFFQEKYLVAVFSDFWVDISFLDHCGLYRKSCKKLHGKTNCCLSKLIVLHQKWLKTYCIYLDEICQDIRDTYDWIKFDYFLLFTVHVH